MKRYVVVILSLLMIVLIYSGNQEVGAWKINTHLYIANIVLEDARDGKVYIPPCGEFSISEQARQALKNPEFYRGGNIGPDGFPDMLTGQSSIHPNTDPWLQLLWNRSEEERNPQIWAFTLGFLTHAGADMWAHDWVNYHSGGSFPGLAEFRKNQADSLLIVTKHMAIENTFDKKIRVSCKEIDIPDEFVLNTLVLSEEAQQAGLPDWLDLLVDLYWEKYKYRNETVLGIDSYDANWFEDLEDGFKAWVATSERAVQATLTGEESMITSLQESWADWATGHYLDMLGVPSFIADSPDRVIKALRILPDEIEQLLIELGIIPMLENMEDEFVNWILEGAIGLNKEEVELLFNRQVDFTIFGDHYLDILAEMAEVPLEENWPHNYNYRGSNNYNDSNNHKQSYNRDQFSKFIQEINVPLYNSIITGKLILLPPEELNRLSGGDYYRNSGSGRNVMLGVLRSIDDSKQWSSGLGGFYIYEKSAVFGRIFKPYPTLSGNEADSWPGPGGGDLF